MSNREVETVHGTPLGEHDRIDPKTGQQVDYVVLSAAERAKGFIRPVRQTYTHVGPGGPAHPTRALTEDERYRFGDGFVVFEAYPEGARPKTGRYWTQSELDAVDKGCKTDTTMSLPLAETYARDPHFYGATFCAHCRTHLPVSAFVWSGTNQRVGS